MDLEILKIASFTENNKNISNHTHFSKLKNSMCGDEIQIKLIILLKMVPPRRIELPTPPLPRL